jgi:hypothetical protein
MTAPAPIKQAHIARVLREAKKIGAKKVHVCPDGSIDIVILEEQLTGADKISVQPEPAERETIIGKPDSKGKNIRI